MNGQSCHGFNLALKWSGSMVVGRGHQPRHQFQRTNQDYSTRSKQRKLSEGESSEASRLCPPDRDIRAPAQAKPHRKQLECTAAGCWECVRRVDSQLMPTVSRGSCSRRKARAARGTSRGPPCGPPSLTATRHAPRLSALGAKAVRKSLGSDGRRRRSLSVSLRLLVVLVFPFLLRSLGASHWECCTKFALGLLLLV